MYISKILEGRVPNPYTNQKVEPYTNKRTGRKCLSRAAPTQAPTRPKSLFCASLYYSGTKTFNSLTRTIRDITGCSVEKFTPQLDKYLW